MRSNSKCWLDSHAGLLVLAVGGSLTKSRKTRWRVFLHLLTTRRASLCAVLSGPQNCWLRTPGYHFLHQSIANHTVQQEITGLEAQFRNQRKKSARKKREWTAWVTEKKRSLIKRGLHWANQTHFSFFGFFRSNLKDSTLAQRGGHGRIGIT